ncbi:MAG: aminoglycoside phosphotransferase family protein [Caldilinea sp. CFX5]|nr:aminoglycoside phosphotransferase family protein [Caldilinea sp. CFX5]
MIETHENAMQRALACLNGVQGKQFTFAEKLPGQSGAWAVDGPDGERGILKVSADSDCATVAQIVRLIEHLRTAGYPTPRPLHYGSIPDGGCFYLQECLPGRPMRAPGFYAELNQHELGLLLRLLERHEGIAPATLPDRTAQVEAIALQQQDEWTVVAQSPLPAVQRLIERCAQRCAGLGDPGWRHSDLVIGDFGPHNILLNEQGQVAAVFDLEGAGRGDRVIDLVGLLYMVELAWLPDVRHAALQVATPAALTACGVYWMVHRLYQGIQSDAENLADVAQQMLDHVDLLT